MTGATTQPGVDLDLSAARAAYQAALQALTAARAIEQQAQTRLDEVLRGLGRRNDRLRVLRLEIERLRAERDEAALTLFIEKATPTLKELAASNAKVRPLQEEAETIQSLDRGFTRLQAQAQLSLARARRAAVASEIEVYGAAAKLVEAEGISSIQNNSPVAIVAEFPEAGALREQAASQVVRLEILDAEVSRAEAIFESLGGR